MKAMKAFLFFSIALQYAEHIKLSKWVRSNRLIIGKVLQKVCKIETGQPRIGSGRYMSCVIRSVQLGSGRFEFKLTLQSTVGVMTEKMANFTFNFHMFVVMFQALVSFR